jgi:hypothetical protein
MEGIKSYSPLGFFQLFLKAIYTSTNLVGVKTATASEIEENTVGTTIFVTGAYIAKRYTI